MALLINATGRSEVDEVALRARHKAICMQLACEELPVLTVPEVNEAIARLCAARLIDPSEHGRLRLPIQIDDIKATIANTPHLAHLFPKQGA